MAMDFQNQVAIVTGAASGIGRACAAELAERGASIAVVDIAGAEDLLKIAEELKKHGRRIETFTTDVRDYEAAARLAEEVRAQFGRVDILVNAAGINQDAPLWKMTEEAWDRVLDVNLKGTFNYIRAIAPIFREQRAGKIVNLASIQALRGRFGISNYAASKGGIISLTKAAAGELGPSNVNVNCVAPGFIKTPLAERLPAEVLKEAEEETVFKRLGQPEDVAHLVAFLCTEAARHITGEVIRIDGGQTL